MTIEATPGHAPTPHKLYADARGKWSWALFDWANQPFFTVVTTFLFIPYLTSQVFVDDVQGTVWMGWTHTIIGISIACLAILLGPIADYTGRRKWWIFGASLLCIGGSWFLYGATPGMPTDQIVLILVAFAIATIGAEIAIMFNHAMLPSLVPDKEMGRLSGNAWGLGYAGGMIVLIFVLVFFSGMVGQAIIPLDAESGEPSRITGPIAAVWFLIFILPLMIWTPDVKHTGYSFAQATRKGHGELIKTVKNVRHYKNIVRFLIARTLYADGINAIIAFGGIYAAVTFDWGLTELGIFGITLNIFAIAGSAWGGYMDDKRSSKYVIYATVTGLAIGAIGILSVTPTSVLFVVPVSIEGNGYTPFFDSPAEQVLMLFAMIIGFCLGPSQAASRTLMARLTPEHHEAQFFGLFAMTGKATTWLAPALIALVTDMTNSQRIGVSVTVVFLMVGLFLLRGVKEDRSVAPGNLPHNDGMSLTPDPISRDQMDPHNLR